jgi:hypothetical protein
VLEVERRDRRLEQRRDDVPAADDPLQLVGRDPVLGSLREPPAELQLLADDRAARPRDDV